MHIEPRRVFHSFHWISPVPTLLFLGKSGNTAWHSFKKNNSSSFTAPLFSAWKRDINSQIRSLRPPSLQKRIRDAYNVSIFEILFIWSILNYIPRCESRLRRSWHPFRRGKNLGDVELIRVYGGHNKQRYILTGWGKERRVRKVGRFYGWPWYRDFHDVIALYARQVNYSPACHMTKAPQGAVQNAV